MLEISVRDIQSYIPSKKLINSELVERLGVENEFLENKIGILNRCIAEESKRRVWSHTRRIGLSFKYKKIRDFKN